MTDISSTSVSWRTVRDIMIAYHEGLPVESFRRPPGLVEAELCMPSGLQATDACPIKNPPDLFVSNRLPSKEDDWWTMAEIDTRTDKLAGPLTPEEFVESRFYLQIPEGLSAWEQNQALEWAKELEDASSDEAPTEQTDVRDLPLAITSPAKAEQVSGDLPILGRAFSLNFISYRLEFRYDTDSSDWQTILVSDNSVPEGLLGTWLTEGLPPGLYSIRLILDDEREGESETRVQILLVPGVGEDTFDNPDPEPKEDEPINGEDTG